MLFFIFSIEYLRRYSGRCPLVHMKDFVRGDKVTLVALGDGELGVCEAAAQAAESGAEWLVVEATISKCPFFFMAGRCFALAMPPAPSMPGF